MGVGYLTGQGGGGSNIKSIQRGTLTLTTTSADVTISEISENSSIVKIYNKPKTSVDIQARNACIKTKITSSTNINFAKNTSGNDVDIFWEAIEFKNIKSIQRGDYRITTQGVLESITISAVDLSKSFIVASWTSTGANSNTAAVMDIAYLDSETVVKVSSSVYVGIIHWQVIEFN